MYLSPSLGGTSELFGDPCVDDQPSDRHPYDDVPHHGIPPKRRLQFVPICLLSTAKIQQVQVTLSSAVSIASHAIGQVWSSYDIRSSALMDAYTNKALSTLFSGKTINAVVVLYGTGVGVISDTLCTNNLVSLRFYNATNATISLDTVRMIVFYH